MLLIFQLQRYQKRIQFWLLNCVGDYSTGILMTTFTLLTWRYEVAYPLLVYGEVGQSRMIATGD